MPYGILAADQIQSSVTGSSIGPGNATRFKNRIINGDMRIDQRNSGALINPAVNGSYYLDRWRAISGAAGKYSIGQNAGAVTPPAGYINYCGLTSLSAYTVGTSEVFGLRHSIEGLNVADLGWGTANAKTVTLSFWVRSSLTGTFGATIRNSAQDRTYPITYTISAANTWELETITITGDTSGTWLTTNGVGIELQFSIGAGATVSGGTVGTWNAANYQSPSGVVSVVGTNGATFYITGVQLEVGSSATGFEYVDYTTQLCMCQRYYSQGYGGVNGFTFSSNTGIASFAYPVQMRTTPTQGYSSGTTTNIDYIGGSQTGITLAASGGGQNDRFYNCTVNGMSGRTTWQGIIMNGNNISFSAEL